MTTNSTDPTPSVIRFSHVILILVIIFFFLFTIYCSYRWHSPPQGASTILYIAGALVSGSFLAFFGFGLVKFSHELKLNLSIMLITIGTVSYGFETYLEFSKEKLSEGIVQARIQAKKMGKPYDTRTALEFLDDLASSGTQVYPNISPETFISSDGLPTSNGKIFPLGGISNITTTVGNESGYFPIVETDEHGFINEKGLYNENNVDILLTGDSFTEGYSVNMNKTIGAVLRKTGFKAVSVGKSGNGPLLELAALKEYAEPMNSKIVLWLYYINDLNNLANELKSPFLRKYLEEDGFSQNLISRQKEIDTVLKTYVRNERKIAQERLGIEPTLNSVKRISKFTNLRLMIKLKPAIPPLPLTDIGPVFKKIVRKANQMTQRMGGKMYFVYLPSYYFLNASLKPGAIKYAGIGAEDRNRDYVLKTINELNIPLIDIYKEVFKSHADPLSLFPFRIYGHYNPEGYRLVANAIRKQLNTDVLLD